MPTPRESKREARLLLITWLLLVALTLGSFWLADSSMPPARAAAWVLGLAALKGLLIAGVFMEMRRGPGLGWAAMSAFLIAESALIVVLLP